MSGLPKGPHEGEGKGDRWIKEGHDRGHYDRTDEDDHWKYLETAGPTTRKPGADADGTEVTAPHTRGHRARG